MLATKLILATKLYVPPAQPTAVPRSRLIGRLNEGLHRRLTLVCAPAGFGKTTLIGEWIAGCGRPAAWLSLEEGDGDPARFLAYLVAALRAVAADIGEGILDALRSPQPPPTEPLLTALLNEIATVEDDFFLVLDDYHLVDAKVVDDAIAFLLEHVPPEMHLIIATREDPRLPLARLRARGQLVEVRAADLRFNPSEAAAFLKGEMGLDLSAEDIAALETRTEGWIAGLQLAALSMRGHEDASSFIESFTGSHRFVLDYLVEEVLQQQPESVQGFLLCTSILDRLCGPLCDAVLLGSSASGRATLEYIERANLFLVPLDDERRWYRYHHLFAELLRQRLHLVSAPSTGAAVGDVAELHGRASAWYEANGLEIEAFRHAAAANDVERAERLIEGEGVPLYFRGTVAPVLNWLESLPGAVLDARPSLWVMYASVLLLVDHTAVEQRLRAAEAALQGIEPNDRTRDLVGRVASMRATLAVIRHDAETIIDQSRRALEYLHPDNLPARTATTWTLGHAHQLQGDRAAAGKAYAEVISTGNSFGDSVYTIAATINLGQLQEADNELSLATKTYERVLELAGDPPQPIACEACLGLARITYQWNDLDAAERHGQQFVQLTRQMGSVDSFASYDVFLARLRLARGDVAGAVAVLVRAEEFVRQHDFVFRMPDVAAARVLTLLYQGHLRAAARLAETHGLPLSRARVYLAQGDASSALASLEPLRRQAEAKGWADERLRVMVLQAVALHAQGEKDGAAQLLDDALALAEPGGFIRVFVDEGRPMAHLLSEAAACGIAPDYTARLLAAIEAEAHEGVDRSYLPAARSLAEPLSQRELEVLRLVAEGLSNREIGARLFLALDTVKGHNRRIFGKLLVHRRTEAVAKARALGILPGEN
ncbi:LuxR family transcriptional regulator [Rubrobacter tropicus]|uniref:LuxR family transcriptional regulator n=1 Tax=Rubrobacter tropicus TaxID=2653851 RepID=A0A6G8QF40_9ACTN|nr:LuxR family transcriptional regulator [Rubrobacter tropicus]